MARHVHIWVDGSPMHGPDAGETSEFFHKVVTENDAPPPSRYTKHASVPLKSLVATQPRYSKPNLVHMEETGHGKNQPVRVTSHGGENYLMDGHHRAILAMMAGKTHIDAEVR